MKILFAGDYCPSGRMLDYFKKRDFYAAFGEVKQLNDKVDYSVVNFESNVALESDKPIKKSGPCLKCDESGVEAIKWAGFDLLCLANNHFRDYGDSAVKRTIESASKNGLDIVGGGFNIDSASKTFYKTIKGVKIGFINVCENEFSIATENRCGSNPLNPIKQYYDIREARRIADNVFVIVHGGHEYCQEPSLRMKQTYRFFIDAGADAIINHHQHCYCSYEVYNGKPIFYGLGNFCFDINNQNVPDTWYEGYAVLIDIKNEVTFELLPYIQCKDTPSVKFLNERSAFDRKIAMLNDVLSDDVKHKEYLYAFYEDNPVVGITVPILNNHWNRLRNFISKHLHPDWYFHIWDYFFCESHRDRMEYELKKITKN